MFGFREFEEDPFYSMHTMHREHMRQMNQMMMDPLHSLFSHHHNPMLSLPHHGNGQQVAVAAGPVVRQRRNDMLMPFGMFGGGLGTSIFGDMNQVMGNMRQQMQNGNMHSYSQSSFMSYSNMGDGQPQVYQATSSTTQAPGGVKETRKSVRDSRSGVEKMSVGHHINDRAHIIERSRNRRTGDEDENQDFVNIDEDEAPAFDQEFRHRVNPHGHRGADRHRLDRHRPHHAITDGRRHAHTPYQRH